VNLGQPNAGQIIYDSGRMSVLKALKETSTSELALIDLSEGDGWWATRLFALCAGGARQGGPETLIFLSGKDTSRYEGCASTRQLRDGFLAARKDFRRAQIGAERITQKILLLTPTPAGQAPPTPPTADPEVQELLSEAFPMQSDEVDPQVFERALLKLLGPIEQAETPLTRITPDELQRLFASILSTARIDRAAEPAQQLNALLSSEGRYVAITDHGIFEGVRERLSLVQNVTNEIVKVMGSG
jgi:hypothetical protein